MNVVGLTQGPCSDQPRCGPANESSGLASGAAPVDSVVDAQTRPGAGGEARAFNLLRYRKLSHGHVSGRPRPLSPLGTRGRIWRKLAVPTPMEDL